MFPNFVGAVFFLNGILTGKACNINETLLPRSAKSSLQRMCHLSIRLTNGVADVTMDVLGLYRDDMIFDEGCLYIACVYICFIHTYLL